jgi:hypothetical protein
MAHEGSSIFFPQTSNVDYQTNLDLDHNQQHGSPIQLDDDDGIRIQTLAGRSPSITRPSSVVGLTQGSTLEVKPRVSEPTPFDGTFENYKTFRQEMDLFIRLCPKMTDEQTIVIILGYMKKGAALAWREAFLDLYESKLFPSLHDFYRLLDNRFKDQVTKEKARDKLENFKQNGNYVDVFLSNLEQIMAQANLSDEEEKIRILQKAVDYSVLETIYNSGQVPTDYNGWVVRIRNIGRLRERFNHQFGKQKGTTPTSNSNTPRTFNINISPDPAKVAKYAEKKTNTGVTYTGAGQPMDIDRTKLAKTKCFGCQQLGHIYANCPNKTGKVDIRAIWFQLDDEERDELRFEVQAEQLQKEEEKKDFSKDQ